MKIHRPTDSSDIWHIQSITPSDSIFCVAVQQLYKGAVKNAAPHESGNNVYKCIRWIFVKKSFQGLTQLTTDLCRTEFSHHLFIMVAHQLQTKFGVDLHNALGMPDVGQCQHPERFLCQLVKVVMKFLLMQSVKSFKPRNTLH